MYSLIEILNQATNQNNSVVNIQPIGYNVINMGVKIQQFNERIYTS